MKQLHMRDCYKIAFNLITDTATEKATVCRVYATIQQYTLQSTLTARALPGESHSQQCCFRPHTTLPTNDLEPTYSTGLLQWRTSLRTRM